MPRRGGDRRGSSKDRLHRKIRMLHRFGDGLTCQCTHCGQELTLATLEADRIIPGGSYRDDNVQPSCGICNKLRGNNPDPRPFLQQVA